MIAGVDQREAVTKKDVAKALPRSMGISRRLGSSSEDDARTEEVTRPWYGVATTKAVVAEVTTASNKSCRKDGDSIINESILRDGNS